MLRPLLRSQLRLASFRPFDYADPLNLASLLTAEEKDIQNVAKQYATQKLMPRIIEANRSEKFDKSIMREMGQLGLLGATIEGYGIYILIV
jgi:glutaryl-CoA dehydrogenase